MSHARRIVYLTIAGISFALGVIGAFLPLMPTTCFMLVAVWAASKGSPRFAGWIRSHPRFGATIVAWESERAIPRHAKWTAGVMLLISMVILAFVIGVLWLKLVLILCLGALTGWILTRPEPVADA